MPVARSVPIAVAVDDRRGLELEREGWRKLTQQVRRSSMAWSYFSTRPRAGPIAWSIVMRWPPRPQERASDCRPSGRRAEPAGRVARRGAVEHARVEVSDTWSRVVASSEKVGVAELGPDVAQVDPPDVGHLPAARRLGHAQRVDEPAHLRILDRVGPPLHQVVERADQDRHDRERPTAPEQVLEEDDLELDRMLGPVAQLVVEQLGAGVRGDPVDVGRGRSALVPRAGSRSPYGSGRTRLVSGSTGKCHARGSRTCSASDCSTSSL